MTNYASLADIGVFFLVFVFVGCGRRRGLEMNDKCVVLGGKENWILCIGWLLRSVWNNKYRSVFSVTISISCITTYAF